MSSESDSSDLLLYSESSVFSEQLYLSLVSDLAPKLRSQSVRTSGLKLFQALGVNVIRLLMTYISQPDFMRITAVCKWFNRLGSDPQTLSIFISKQTLLELQTGEIRTVFAEKYRETTLKRKSRPLYKEIIFAEELVSVIHVQTIAARLVLFSHFEAYLYVWECAEGKTKTIGKYGGVKQLVDSWVGDDGAILIGETRLVYIESHWISSGFEERKSHYVDFPTAANMATIHKLPNFPYIVLTRLAVATIYSLELEAIKSLEWTASDMFLGKIFTPRLKRPVVMLIKPKKYVTYSIDSGEETVRSMPALQSVEKVDMLSFPCTPRALHYLIIQGFNLHTSHLYANSALLTSDISAYHVHHCSLLVFIRPYKYCIYTASIAAISLTHTVTLQPMTFTFFLNAYSKLVCVQVQQSIKYDHTGPRKDYKTKIWFGTLRGAEIVADSLQDIAIETAFATRNEVVLIGPHYSHEYNCVVILRYLRDAKEKDFSVEDRFKKYAQDRGAERVEETEEERRVWELARRKERREEAERRAERKRVRKTKFWKQKIRKVERVDLRLAMREK